MTPLGVMLASRDPELRELAVARVSAILAAAEGNVREASRQSGIPLRTLRRWIASEPELQDVLRMLRREAGWVIY
jgi:hypothetical protein